MGINPAVHALYLSTAPEARGGVVDNLKALLANPAFVSNTSLQLTVCHIFLVANLLREALQCDHMGLIMEHLAMCIQIYIKINRLDLVEGVVEFVETGG